MPNFETAQELFDELCRPFAAEEIEWRIGSTNADKTKGMALAYMDARAVMDRFDAVCGPDGWQCNYTMAGAIAICNIGVLMPSDRWIWKADGAGATDVEGEKGMLSDALKRAAVRWRRPDLAAVSRADERYCERPGRDVQWRGKGSRAQYRLRLACLPIWDR
ncbi:Rad52/Rad22 family DNA repair protein [Bradyrhizobium daqingense]|uniref:Rad52/Rad22 family DNA repair protein n=1 Tax=Bradyrhizobium daqingense TaxID=993502 RepID=UPI0038362E99